MDYNRAAIITFNMDKTYFSLETVTLIHAAVNKGKKTREPWLTFLTRLDYNHIFLL